jgi:hypothetical protein
MRQEGVPSSRNLPATLLDSRSCPLRSETIFYQNADLVVGVRRFALPYIANEDSCRRSQVNSGSDENMARHADPNLGIHPSHDLHARGRAHRHHGINDFHATVDGPDLAKMNPTLHVVGILQVARWCNDEAMPRMQEGDSRVRRVPRRLLLPLSRVARSAPGCKSMEIPNCLGCCRLCRRCLPALRGSLARIDRGDTPPKLPSPA